MRLAYERRMVTSRLSKTRPDIWLTYHTYYKAPDLLGPYCSQHLNIPYVIFQGIYSTKRRKQLKTWPGYILNKKVLLAADHIFTNKKKDLKNLKRLIPDDRIDYIAPGIHPAFFTFSEKDRCSLRQKWRLEQETVIMTTAMMRPGVKADGISSVIKWCAEINKAGHKIKLVIAGDGECREQLTQEANQLLPGKVIFLGMIPRPELYKYYSSADIFVFPGVNESLGMVYLEAQSCGLPIVAYQNWGGGEAVLDQTSGLLAPYNQPEVILKDIKQLIENTELRQRLSRGAAKHIRTHHDLHLNYEKIEVRLTALHQR